MTSEASDLPDWKDRIPRCLAAELDNSIFSQSLNRSVSSFPEGKSLGEIMASCEPSSQSENQSPQPSCSGYPGEVTVGEVIPGPSGEEAGRRDRRGLTTEEEGP